MMKDGKFCRDCAHYVSKQCWHKNNLIVNLVDGREFPRSPASWLRDYDGKCGPTGKMFQRKHRQSSLWQRLKKWAG
jgi:hypothetical protein